MRLYLIGGLGADKRIFNSLSLNANTTVIEWVDPLDDEGIESYVLRLSDQIDQGERIGIVGVSFGGIIAVELTKIIKSELTILISSVERSIELPKKYITLGRSGVLKAIPNVFMKPPQFIFNFMFGAVDRRLLKSIIRDTNPSFLRWALRTIINWDSDFSVDNCIRIHGTNDKMIPLIGSAIEVENGEHFMIVDRAIEISAIINKQVRIAEENS